MTTYEAQTLETAPEKSRDAMQRLKNSAGMVPNLAARMSTSPTLIEAFVTLREIVQAGTLDAKERETLGLTNAVENGCEWCVAFHSFVALKLGMAPAAVEQLRAGKDPADPRLSALARFRDNSSPGAAGSIAPSWTRSSRPDSARIRRWRSWRRWPCRCWPTMPATLLIRNWTRRSADQRWSRGN